MTLYFSSEPGASNANPGTEAEPKRDLTGVDVNALPAGSSLRFKRDGTFPLPNVRLRNLNTSEANPLTFEAYGEGFQPLLQSNGANGFEFGLNFGDWAVHEGYVFRGLNVRGTDGAGTFGFWGKGNVRGVLIEHCTISNWHVGVDGQGGHDSRHFTVRNNSIYNNRAMGILGEFYDSTFEGNDFSGPGLPSHHFVHLLYLRDGGNLRVANNRLLSAGPALGGTFTMHGLIDGLVIEDNDLRYGPGSDPGAWVVSLIPDSGAAQGGFRNLVVRRNTIQNAGNNGFHIEAAPGALVEDNLSILTEARYQTAIAYADDPGRPQDLKGGGTMRNNRAQGPAGATMTFNAPVGSTVGGNVFETV